MPAPGLAATKPAPFGLAAGSEAVAAGVPAGDERKVIQLGSQRVLASSLSIGAIPVAVDGTASAQDKLAAVKGLSEGVGWKSNPTSAVAAAADATVPAGGLAAAGRRASSKQQWATGTGLKRLTRAPSNVNRILKPPQLAGDSDSEEELDSDLQAAAARATGD